MIIFIQLLNQDSFKTVYHVNQILFAIGIVKKGGVKSDTVQIYGFRPLPKDVLGPNKVIMCIAISALLGLNICIYQKKSLSVIA